jgi:cysteine desulfurase / selenocysteine lyase
MQTKRIRADFPILSPKREGKPLIYLDSACMALKPRPVIDAVVEYYEEYPMCGERSVHKRSSKVSVLVDEARETARAHFNAPSKDEIVFLRNTTEAINLVAHAFGLKRGDEVISGDKEHNSNLAPWHLLRKQQGIRYTIVRSGKDETFDLEAFKAAVTKKTKLVSIGHTANLDGSSVPAREIVEIAHDKGAAVLLDGAQSAPHEPIDVRKLDCDFFACSVHKMCGPTGVGLLYGRAELLERMDPVNPGGSTVAETTYTDAVFLKPPRRFEGGLQDYAGILGGAAALRYLDAVGMEEISAHVRALNRRVTKALEGAPGLSLIGPKDADQRGAIFSFVVDGVDSHDVALMLDEAANIAVRSGNHCVHSWLRAHGLKGTARASFYLYNTADEVDRLVEVLRTVVLPAR